MTDEGSATAFDVATPSPRTSGGRPADPTKRVALIEAARALFLSSGVEGVKVDRVIAAAGVSRATYYRNFVGRDDLLAAVFERESRRIAPDGMVAGTPEAGLRDQLVRYGDAMMRFLADPDTMRFEFSVEQVRGVRPELADALFEAGPGRAWAHLRRILTEECERGEISMRDPAQAVEDLVGLWIGAWRTEVAYGHRAIPDETEQHRRSRHAVDLFLRAHRAPVERSSREPIEDESVS